MPKYQTCQTGNSHYHTVYAETKRGVYACASNEHCSKDENFLYGALVSVSYLTYQSISYCMKC